MIMCQKQGPLDKLATLRCFQPSGAWCLGWTTSLRGASGTRGWPPWFQSRQPAGSLATGAVAHAKEFRPVHLGNWDGALMQWKAACRERFAGFDTVEGDKLCAPESLHPDKSMFHNSQLALFQSWRFLFIILAGFCIFHPQIAALLLADVCRKEITFC